MSCSRVKLVKCAFLFYLFFLGVLSATTTIFAAWLLIDILGYSHFLSPNVVSGPPIALLVAGIVLLPIIILIGFRALAQKSHALAIVFWVIVSVSAILCLALGVWSMLLRVGLLERLQVDMLQATPPGDRNDIEREHWNYLQRSLRCCGTYGASDYKAVDALPMSCCVARDSTCIQINKLNCLEALNTYGGTKLAQVAIAAAILAVLMLIGIYAGCSYSGLLKNKSITVDQAKEPEDVPLTMQRKIFLKDHEFNRM